MKISFSELIFLNNSVVENVDRLLELGTDRIELMMDGSSWDLTDEELLKLATRLKASETIYSIHPAAWDVNLTAEMADIRSTSFKLHQRAIHLAQSIQATSVVLHPGFLGSPCFNRERAKERSKTATKLLTEEARRCGVVLAFENVGINGQSIYTEDEFCQSIDDHGDGVGYLIDLGHAHINGWNIPRVLKLVADKLLGYHIHDNDGKRDQHLPIFEGTILWDEVFNTMSEIHKPHHEYILEYAPGVDERKLVEGADILTKRVLNK